MRVRTRRLCGELRSYN
ncbi:unnamed protein product [Kuraishia capsulata CBS 1993]|uniref:Uncharacterized protein n=1 Tax=Kuraishia capsulata CBS 1993 TaxID=1382522 RepID=W6MSE3_9ASCO|nr:unnamed protein product [Kuraishia capsulata CBS 1993]